MAPRTACLDYGRYDVARKTTWSDLARRRAMNSRAMPDNKDKAIRPSRLASITPRQSPESPAVSGKAVALETIGGPPTSSSYTSRNGIDARQNGIDPCAPDMSPRLFQDLSPTPCGARFARTRTREMIDRDLPLDRTPNTPDAYGRPPQGRKRLPRPCIMPVAVVYSLRSGRK